MSFAGGKLIWMNGQMVPWEQATVHVMAHALHYGSSVFEGIQVLFPQRLQFSLKINLQ